MALRWLCATYCDRIRCAQRQYWPSTGLGSETSGSPYWSLVIDAAKRSVDEEVSIGIRAASLCWRVRRPAGLMSASQPTLVTMCRWAWPSWSLRN